MHRCIYLSLALLLAWSSLSCQAIRGKKTLRIGTNDSPPFNFWSPQGQPSGFAIDVLNRAAQKAGYELQWVRSSTGPEATFASGAADIWPFVTVHDDRRKAMYLSEPWWRSGAILFFRESLALKRIEDFADKSVALTSPARRFLPKVQFPPSTRLEVFESPELTFERMCTGKVDAALLDYRISDGVLLNRTAACPPMQIGSLLLEDVVREFSIASRFGFESEVDRLRAAIDELAESGEILEIATKWKQLHKADWVLIAWLDKTRAKNERLKVLFWAAILILCVALFFMQRLAIARKQADLGSKARSQFLANMSHEIRTPMNGILGMTELTLETELNDEQREYLSMARNSARSLLEILDDILDFSRIDSGNLAIEFIPFDLRDVAKRSVQILSFAAQSKGLILESQWNEVIPLSLTGDPGRLQQVLINLIGNAVKFTETGTVRLVITAQHVASGNWRVSFSVTDTGIGITADQQKHIFKAFTQADSSTTRRFGGTGLGLSISSQLVRMMGGSLEVQSLPGAGSTFSFTLEMQAAEPVVPPVAAGQANPSRPLKILVAEDNAVNRALIQRILERAGHRVDSVVNGKLALLSLEANHYDAVLMDVHMPEMDGLEATRKIRERERLSGAHIPVIALTALAVRGDSERCLAAGMDAYLVKPLNTADLFALLARIESEQTDPFATSS